jgi:hypothetical protein
VSHTLFFYDSLHEADYGRVGIKEARSGVPRRSYHRWSEACYSASSLNRMDLTETLLALGGCMLLLTTAVVLDRRPYRPGKFNYVPLMIVFLAACLVLGRHLVSLLQ